MISACISARTGTKPQTLRVLPPFSVAAESQSQREPDIKVLGGNQKPRREGPTQPQRIQGKKWAKPVLQLCRARCTPHVLFCLETSLGLQPVLPEVFFKFFPGQARKNWKGLVCSLYVNIYTYAPRPRECGGSVRWRTLC